MERAGTRKARQTFLRLGLVLGLGMFGTLVSLGPVAPPDARADIYSFKDRRGVLHFTNAPTDGRFRAVPDTSKRITRLSFTQTRRAPTAGLGRASFFGTGRSRRAFFSPRSEAPPEIARLIDETAQRYGVDPALVHAVVRAESAFDHLAVSRAGAQGLMQLMPTTASEIGVRNAFHPRENIEGGVYYLREMLDRFSGDTRLALAAYNAGPAAVDSHGGVPPYAETQDYVNRVFRYRQEHLLRQKLAARLARTSSPAR